MFPKLDLPFAILKHPSYLEAKHFDISRRQKNQSFSKTSEHNNNFVLSITTRTLKTPTLLL